MPGALPQIPFNISFNIGPKFHPKIILIFWTKFSRKRSFLPETEVNIAIEFNKFDRKYEPNLNLNLWLKFVQTKLYHPIQILT